MSDQDPPTPRPMEPSTIPSVIDEPNAAQRFQSLISSSAHRFQSVDSAQEEDLGHPSRSPKNVEQPHLQHFSLEKTDQPQVLNSQRGEIIDPLTVLRTVMKPREILRHLERHPDVSASIPIAQLITRGGSEAGRESGPWRDLLRA